MGVTIKPNRPQHTDRQPDTSNLLNPHPHTTILGTIRIPMGITIIMKWYVKNIRKNAVPQLPEQWSLKVVKLGKKKSVIGSLSEFLNLSITLTAETKRRKYVELRKRLNLNRSRSTLIRRFVAHW